MNLTEIHKTQFVAKSIGAIFLHILDPSNKVNVTGYILNVSPLKRSKSNKEYFNLDIETQTNVRNAVCFSPSKRLLFNEAALNHTGCEIQNAVDNEDKTLFASDYSTIKTTELGFPRTNTYKYLTLHEVINEVIIIIIITLFYMGKRYTVKLCKVNYLHP